MLHIRFRKAFGKVYANLAAPILGVWRWRAVLAFARDGAVWPHFAFGSSLLLVAVAFRLRPDQEVKALGLRPVHIVFGKALRVPDSTLYRTSARR